MLVSSKQNRLIDTLSLIVIYAVSILIVHPLGDFPLMDDWAYARAVQGLVGHGDWRPISFISASLITQSLWGAIFCIPAGFSFNALRFSTLSLAMVGIISVYVLFITNDRRRLLAVIGALTLGFNPIYYVLSITFMTDVPFTALAILSSIFFVRCIRRFRYLDLSIACVLAVAATLCRQLGLFLPLGFAVALTLQHGFGRRWLARAILPSVVCAAALTLFQHWMTITGRMPAFYGNPPLPVRLSIRGIGSRADAALLYLGLFCLPILLLGSSAARPNTSNTILRVLPAFLGGLFALFSIYFNWNLLERYFSGNILSPFGLGPPSLRGDYEKLPASFWSIVTFFSVFGGALLVRNIVASSIALIQKTSISKMNDESIIQIFFLTAVGSYSLPILVFGFYDRYLVPLVPFLLYLNTGPSPREAVGVAIRKVTAAVLIAFTAVFAILGTRGYMTWNRLRWEILAELQQNPGISAHDIDGGFEYNGWFLYDPMYQETPNKSWWWVQNDRYVIAFSKISGYKVVKKYEYFTWIPPKVRTLFVLKRDPY